MTGFNMDDYVDVAERIRVFHDQYPEGCLQSEITRLDDGWLCKAFAYRSPADERPGIGHAFEPVPGKTPYTKDSEAMNAETSAWGRAIVALGFETKKIASRNEVQARQSNGGAAGIGDHSATPAGEMEVHFGKNRGRKLSSLTPKQLSWYADEWTPDPQFESEQDRALKRAANELVHGSLADDEIPF